MTVTTRRQTFFNRRFSAAGSFGAIAFAAALLGSPLGASAASTAPGASLPPCAISGGVSVVLATASPAGDLSPQCVPQSAQVLVIVTNPSSPLVSPVPIATAVPFDMHLVTADTRIDSYAKRQAIRDTYRGQIDETTFNDELGDGVSLDQALADALAAFGQKHP